MVVLSAGKTEKSKEQTKLPEASSTYWEKVSPIAEVTKLTFSSLLSLKTTIHLFTQLYGVKWG